MGVVRAWQCPECGRLGESSLGRMLEHSTTLASLDGTIRQTTCHGVSVPVFVVPASETRQGWMVASPDPDKETLYIHTSRIAAWESPVGVFALPEENTE